jgi:hypothetical protein
MIDDGEGMLFRINPQQCVFEQRIISFPETMAGPPTETGNYGQDGYGWIQKSILHSSIAITTVLSYVYHLHLVVMTTLIRRTKLSIPYGLFSLVPPALLCYFTVAYTVDIPFWDQFVIAHLLEEIDSHRLTILSASWPLHNEHRLFFPNMLMLSIAQVTDWNIRVETFVVLLLAIGAAALVLGTVVNELAPRSFASASIVLSMLLFSTSQWENWLWGYQIAPLLMIFSVLVVIFATSRPVLTPMHMSVSLVFAVVASLSFFTGLLSWPLMLWIIAQRTTRLNRLYYLLTISVIAVTVFVCYFNGYHGFHGELKPGHISRTSPLTALSSNL